MRITVVLLLLAATLFAQPQQVVVISHRVWRELYQSDPNIVGNPIRFAEVATTIVCKFLNMFLDMMVPPFRTLSAYFAWMDSRNRTRS